MAMVPPAMMPPVPMMPPRVMTAEMMSAKVTAAMVPAEAHMTAVMTTKMMAAAVMAVVAATMMAAARAGKRHVRHGKGAHGERRDAYDPGFHRFLSSTLFSRNYFREEIKREKEKWIDLPQCYFLPG
ncbi:MAG TPA: hypothetical protein VHD34_10250 [Xanthobacteraceae bacterium]|nr:hypothetical protein [Xanthobacteraceae bacterium]